MADQRLVFRPHFRIDTRFQQQSSLYTVRAGDTLESIARDHKVTKLALTEANPTVKQLGGVQQGMAIVVPMAGKRG